MTYMKSIYAVNTEAVCLYYLLLNHTFLWPQKLQFQT